MFDYFGWFSRNKNIEPEGYNVQLENTVFTKGGKVLIVTKERSPTQGEISDYFKKSAEVTALLLSSEDLPSSNEELDPWLSDFVDSLSTSRFSEKTLESIATGSYDDELMEAIEKPGRHGNFVKVRYADMPDEGEAIAALLVSGSKRHEAYMRETAERWTAYIPVFDRPRTPRQVEMGITNQGFNRSYIDVEGNAGQEEVREVVGDLYRAGLYWRFKQLENKSAKLMEEHAFKALNKLLLKLPIGNQRNVNSKEAMRLWNVPYLKKAFNEIPN